MRWKPALSRDSGVSVCGPAGFRICAGRFSIYNAGSIPDFPGWSLSFKRGSIFPLLLHARRASSEGLLNNERASAAWSSYQEPLSRSRRALRCWRLDSAAAFLYSARVIGTGTGTGAAACTDTLAAALICSMPHRGLPAPVPARDFRRARLLAQSPTHRFRLTEKCGPHVHACGPHRFCCQLWQILFRVLCPLGSTLLVVSPARPCNEGNACHTHDIDADTDLRRKLHAGLVDAAWHGAVH